MENLEILALCLLVIVFAVIGIVIGLSGFDRWEKHECVNWQAQSQNFENWYATNWQVEQCKNYDIDLSEYLAK